MTSHLDWSRRPLSLVLAALVAAGTILFAGLGLFGPFEDGLTARRAEMLNRTATGQVAVVEIDARSLEELRSWPWPRRYHAEVVRQLHKSGASIIAFDVDFSAKSDGDEELAAAIREAGHVVLPVFEQTASAGGVRDNEVLSNRPDTAFRDAWIGGVNIFPDADGVVRDYPAATVIDEAIQPSIATLLAENDAFGDRSFEPDWSIDTRTIPRFSFADVMKGRIFPADLQGKRIVIGATAIELGDRYTVPRYGVVPGVVVQALAAESLLQNRAIVRTGWPITIAGILLIAFLLTPRPVRRPVHYAALASGLLVAISAAPIVVQRNWPVSVDSVAWLFTLVAAVAVQLSVEAKRRLRVRAQFDAESGLPNRTSLERLLSDTAGSVLVAGAIERFEFIRDGIGLAATNEMISKAADQVARMVDGQVYRIAPDVIAWVLQSADEAAVHSTLRHIQNEFREPVDSSFGPVDVTFTIGLDGDGFGSAPVLRIERALAAIGNARTKGRAYDWYQAADPQMRRQLSMMSDLRQAMERGGMRLAYQPKLSLETGRIGDAEALIRWYGDDGRTVSPDEFIPLAEATGVIREVTVFALRTAIADLSAWALEGMSMRVAVNVSALDLATGDFAGDVERILCDANVPSSRLALEVTESALIRSPAEAIAALNRLRELGVRLSVDDYGTGQSTLSYLKHLPVHELKIDKSFVTNLTSSESDAIMVRSTINLAHDLGLQVVAEGIEDVETLTTLRELGCDYAQGYFISKPIGSAELLALVSGSGKAKRVA